MKLKCIFTVLCLLSEFDSSFQQLARRNPEVSNHSKVCYLEAVEDPSYYIIHIGQYSILRRCKRGYTYSSTYCDCIRYVPRLSRTPRVAVFLVHERLLEAKEETVVCRPYFRFIFDRTTVSHDKSVPSLPSNTIKFTEVPGSTGSTALTFYGDGILTIWGMSYITFASKFKFMVRFKLMENYQYEDKDYNLFGDGPCGNNPPNYGITVNPVNQTINGNFVLQNKSELKLSLDDNDFSDWILLFLVGVEGQLRMFTTSDKDMAYMGTSTMRSSACALEIGKDSQYAAGFVGYVDSLEFYNCFEK